MANLTITLKTGLKRDGVFQKEVEIRPMTAGDSMYANEMSEKPFFTPAGGVVIVRSPELVGQHILLRRIVRIGSIQAPISKLELESLSYEDYEQIIKATEENDNTGVNELGRSDSSL